MAKDLISVFLGMKPFSSQFLYIFRLLNFFFSSDYWFKTAIHHFIKNSFLPLQHTAAFLSFFFRPSTGTSQVKTFTQKKTKTKKQKQKQKKQKKGKNNSNLSLLMLYFWSNWSPQACRGSHTGLNFFFRSYFHYCLSSAHWDFHKFTVS